MDYVYLRSNPDGMHWEYWQHVNGCRSWFRLQRDTVTHEVLTVELSTLADKEGGPT